MKLIRILVLSVFVLSLSLHANAQSFLVQKDLSQFKAETLTEADIAKIKDQMQTSNLTIDQLKMQATAKGMPAAEFEKLSLRLMAKDNKTDKLNEPMNQIGRNVDFIYTDKKEDFKFDTLGNLIFGSELFLNKGSIASNANIATPLNYELGPNDVLKIVLYGIQEFNAELKVSYEGNISIPNVGVIKVGGLSIEAATEKIRQQMARSVYSSLKLGESKLAISLSNIRTIYVTIIGAKNPGTQNLSSLSTVFNALSIAGGPSSIGSYRNIELVRNNKVIRVVDLYRFILNGDQSDNIGLKDNDVIRIPAYQSRVEVIGQVKRPGIFELTNKENFSKILEFAGGFNDMAYTNNVKVIQKDGRELQVKDLVKSEFDTYAPKGGDVFVISKILNRFQNRVKLTGAVYRPDTYQLVEGMRIADLIKKGEGLKEDAFANSAQLFRLKPNLIKEIVNINISKALAGDKTENLFLQREDELFISSILDLRDSFYVKINGEVHLPNKYAYSDSMTVKDLIILAGGLTNAANSKVEIVRMYIQNNETVQGNIIASILNTEIDINYNFKPGYKNIILQPYDVVNITRKVGYAESQTVSITGQVNYAGKYSLINRVERVSDIIKRAGGIINNAFVEGAYIKRLSIKADTISMVIKDSLKKAGIELETSANVQNIALELKEVINNPGSGADLVLEDKDEIIIPKFDNKVTIRGGVLRPITISYREGLTVGDCISAAGGVAENSRRNKAYVVYFNGRAKRTRSFGLFRFNPKIEPGSQVVLPEGENRKDPLTATLQFTTVLAQIFTALATAKLLSK